MILEALFSGFRWALTFTYCFDLNKRLSEGRAAYRSANNVRCIYEEVPTTYLHNVVDKARSLELFNESPNQWMLDRARAYHLGITGEGVWTSSSANEITGSHPEEK